MAGLTITTVKTARAAFGGATPSLGELRAFVKQCDEKHVPDTASVQINQSQGGGLTAASIHVTWTAAVDPSSSTEAAS